MSSSVFSDIASRFFNENRGQLQQYRVEQLVERTKLILDSRDDELLERAFAILQKTVGPLIGSDLDSTSEGPTCDTLIDVLAEADLPAGETGKTWSDYERWAIGVLVILDTVKVTLSVAPDVADLNASVIDLAEDLCQVAFYSFMEHLFPGRQPDLFRLAELAVLTGLGVVTQALDGKPFTAMRPLAEEVFLQPAFLDHAKAAITEIQNIGKRKITSAGGRNRHAATNAARGYAIERYRSNPERWKTVGEAAKTICIEVYRKFGNDILSDSNGERTVTDWLRPYDPKRTKK